jgi:hypothetical protein
VNAARVKFKGRQLTLAASWFIQRANRAELSIGMVSLSVRSVNA